MKEIFEAALHNDTSVIKEYLKFGNVNICDESHSSLLHYAARGNAIDVANLLLDNYININIVNDKGENPLIEALSRGELGFCKILSRYNANGNIINKNNESVFFKAILKGRNDILDLLYDTLQIDFKLVNNNGENALFYAIKAYNNDLFFKLAENHPDLLNQRNYFNTNILMLAIKYDNYEVFNYLFDKFPNLYECDLDNNNIIFYASRYASSNIMKMILDKKPIIAGKNKNEETIFDVAMKNIHPTLDLINNYNEGYEYIMYRRTYPFHVAVIGRNYDLLDYGTFDIKKRDTLGISIYDYIKLLNDPIILKMFKVQ